ncbi:hypothetical protein LPJ78_003700 [Coemansia sp. RSA 989]|nr:hypothetical protein BX667DRAFT_517659 [Coemansia mojavensis]KAJ1863963.1 hypothetical protein LPJ78_003700 [Coemansia sp. RSA 989]KAJ1871689.1 hypothetical protein LPJ55_003697 [Coemansia sp. RSA 990]KAJ2632716.1 hypothetical protein H4R22_001041 [Coemansia sp. RSA 1290]KAJ2647426.1 hypothetical protein IWW40_004696 [Coemansia sp. RSA 1250]
MSQNNELSAEAVDQALGAKASVQEAQAQQFQALMASASNNQDPNALNLDKKKEYYKHLIGKKYIRPEEHEQLKAQGKGGVDQEKEFTKEHLPELHRVVEANGIMTMDYRPDRLNVHLDEDDKCKNISWV